MIIFTEKITSKNDTPLRPLPHFCHQTLPCGKQIPLPPCLLGQLGTDPSKKTICLYGHLDVQPALKVQFCYYFYKKLNIFFHFLLMLFYFSHLFLKPFGNHIWVNIWRRGQAYSRSLGFKESIDIGPQRISGGALKTSVATLQLWDSGNIQNWI